MAMTRDNPRIKRPMNAFLVWATPQRRRLNILHPGLKNADISKVLGQRWRQMTNQQKNPYFMEASQLKVQHQLKYPTYKYQPRKGKGPRRMKENMRYGVQVPLSKLEAYSKENDGLRVQICIQSSSITFYDQAMVEIAIRLELQETFSTKEDAVELSKPADVGTVTSWPPSISSPAIRTPKTRHGAQKGEVEGIQRKGVCEVMFTSQAALNKLAPLLAVDATVDCELFGKGLTNVTAVGVPMDMDDKFCPPPFTGVWPDGPRRESVPTQFRTPTIEVKFIGEETTDQESPKNEMFRLALKTIETIEVKFIGEEETTDQESPKNEMFRLALKTIEVKFIGEEETTDQESPKNEMFRLALKTIEVKFIGEEETIDQGGPKNEMSEGRRGTLSQLKAVFNHRGTKARVQDNVQVVDFCWLPPDHQEKAFERHMFSQDKQQDGETIDDLTIEVKFIGEEETIDQEGPKNEMFRLALEGIFSTIRCWDIQRKKGDDTKYLDKRDHKGHILPPLLGMEHHDIVPDVLHKSGDRFVWSWSQIYAVKPMPPPRQVTLDEPPLVVEQPPLEVAFDAIPVQKGSIVAGNWRKISQEEKQPFVQGLQALKLEHACKNPGYKYKPKRRKPRKDATLKESSLEEHLNKQHLKYAVSLSNEFTGPSTEKRRTLLEKRLHVGAICEDVFSADEMANNSTCGQAGKLGQLDVVEAIIVERGGGAGGDGDVGVVGVGGARMTTDVALETEEKRRPTKNGKGNENFDEYWSKGRGKIWSCLRRDQRGLVQLETVIRYTTAMDENCQFSAVADQLLRFGRGNCDSAGYMERDCRRKPQHNSVRYARPAGKPKLERSATMDPSKRSGQSEGSTVT
ncbi:Transcription factor SOX-7 [Branchiostoma belcheri]|nr:Transcription factor SOX-7 [Branchiostoma belcheri]